MSDEPEHGLFSTTYDAREQVWEAYCVCGEYALGSSSGQAEELLRYDHPEVGQ